MEFVLFAFASSALVCGFAAVARKWLEARRRRARARRLQRQGHAKVREAASAADRAVAKARGTYARARNRDLRRLTAAFSTLQPTELKHVVFDVRSLRPEGDTARTRGSSLGMWIIISPGLAGSFFVVAVWIASKDLHPSRTSRFDHMATGFGIGASFAATVTVGAIAIAAMRDGSASVRNCARRVRECFATLRWTRSNRSRHASARMTTVFVTLIPRRCDTYGRTRVPR